MTDSKEESKKISNSKRVSVSRAMEVSSSRSGPKSSSRLKEGVLLVALSLVIMVSAYFIYNSGFGTDSGLIGNANNDGICQSTENCLDQQGDCKCEYGKICSQDKTCVDDAALPGDLGLVTVEDLDMPLAVNDEIPSLLLADVSISNCTYLASENGMACDTNCMSDQSANATLSVIDSNSSLAIARESSFPIALGEISFGEGKVIFKPSHVEYMGSVLSLGLSELNNDTGKWMVFMSCNNPLGSASVTGVAR